MVSFIIFFLLVRLLEPEVFGLVALASVFVAFMQAFLDQGFSQAIVQRHDLEPEHLDTAFWTNTATGALLTTIGIAAAEVVASLFHQPLLAPIIRWLSLSFLFSALSSVQNAILNRRFAFKDLAARSLVATFAGGLTGVFMALQGFGVWSLVGQQLVNGLVGVLVLWRASDWRPKFNISVRHFEELFAFGINILGLNVLYFFNRRLDDLLIGYFLGPVALGYYFVAYRVLLVVTQLLTSTMTNVALPTFSRLQTEPERLRRAFYTVTQFTSLIAFPVFLAIAALAPELVQVFFGEKWAPSIPVLQVLAFIGVLHSVSHFNGTVFSAVGKPSWSLAQISIHTVTNVIAFVLVVRWGILAVAAAYVIRGYLLTPMDLWILHKLIHIKLTTYFRQLAAPLVGSVIMVAAIFGTRYFLSSLLSLQLSLAVYIVVGAIVYTGLILLIAPVLFQQAIGLINSAIPNAKRRKK